MFCDILKGLRKQRGLSQSELANHLGVAKSTVSMYEVGNRTPDYEMLKSIAIFFNVDTNILFEFPQQTEKPIDGDEHIEYTDTEKTLIEYFRNLDESDRFKVIQYTMNLSSEAEKKSTAKAT